MVGRQRLRLEGGLTLGLTLGQTLGLILGLTLVLTLVLILGLTLGRSLCLTGGLIWVCRAGCCGLLAMLRQILKP